MITHIDINDFLKPEEASTLLTWGDFLETMLYMLNTIADMDKESYEVWHKSICDVTDSITQRLKDVEYERIRDLHFFINLFSSLGYGPMDHLYEYYEKYCVEYDKLNKDAQ